MKQRWIDGFIVCSLSSDAPHIRSLRDEELPPLCWVNRFEESDIGKVDTVTSDNFQIGYDATRYLARIGHKRIAIVCGREELLLYRERLRGYLQGAFGQRSARTGGVPPARKRRQQWFLLSNP